MIIGLDDKIEFFKKLIEKESLFHAYMFFGEPQVGKFLFAISLANYLEKKSFSQPLDKEVLEETLMISPDDKSVISIDTIRPVEHFLFQKPIFSKKRTIIIRDAENLTFDAQNAILKIVEEPPKESLIIFIVSDKDLVNPALSSRFQKIYFPRARHAQIEDFLVSKLGKKITQKRAEEIVKISFGRAGRALELATDKEFEKIKKISENVKIEDVEKIIDGNLNKFFEFLIINLRENLNNEKNIYNLKEVLRKLTIIKTTNVNKKLQLKSMIADLKSIHPVRRWSK